MIEFCLGEFSSLEMADTSDHEISHLLGPMLPLHICRAISVFEDLKTQCLDLNEDFKEAQEALLLTWKIMSESMEKLGYSKFTPNVSELRTKFQNGELVRYYHYIPIVNTKRQKLICEILNDLEVSILREFC